jgi:hypothetical protein
MTSLLQNAELLYQPDFVDNSESLYWKIYRGTKWAQYNLRICVA